MYCTGGWRETRQFVVESKKDDTESGIIKSFCLKPKDGNAVTDYKPGQYITLKVIWTTHQK